MENKLYREVSVTDRLPQIETIVQTIHPDTYVNIIHAMVLDKKGNWFFYPSDIHGCEPIAWLEEVPTISDNPDLNQPRPQLKLGI